MVKKSDKKSKKAAPQPPSPPTSLPREDYAEWNSWFEEKIEYHPQAAKAAHPNNGRRRKPYRDAYEKSKVRFMLRYKLPPIQESTASDLAIEAEELLDNGQVVISREMEEGHVTRFSISQINAPSNVPRQLSNQSSEPSQLNAPSNAPSQVTAHNAPSQLSVPLMVPIQLNPPSDDPSQSDSTPPDVPSIHISDENENEVVVVPIELKTFVDNPGTTTTVLNGDITKVMVEAETVLDNSPDKPEMNGHVIEDDPSVVIIERKVPMDEDKDEEEIARKSSTLPIVKPPKRKKSKLCLGIIIVLIAIGILSSGIAVYFAVTAIQEGTL